VKLHTVFLREGCTLPEQFDLRQAPFCKGWTEANETLVTQLDFGIRGASWHFMWIAGSHSSRGLGRTQETAVHKALVRALGQVMERFNAAEFGSMTVTSFLGFTMARVTIHARHIQKHASLDRAEGSRVRQLQAQ
jgi:hypothetical protein